MKNHWIIGDIHGEAGLLERLLDYILRFHPHQLIFLGDYIDRGPNSKQVVDRILSLDLPVTCLMGNHEQMLLDAMENSPIGYSPMELWYYNGGEATLLSFGFNSFFSFRSEMDPGYIEFFAELKMSYVLELPGGRKILLVHAGISPQISLEDLLQLSNYRDLSTYMLRKHLSPEHTFLWVRQDFFRSSPEHWKDHLVVHGHTPVPKLKRFVSANGATGFSFIENDIAFRKQDGRLVSVDIDSGSTLNGRLTALGFFEEDQGGSSRLRMRSLTVSREEVFPRDLGLLNSL